MNCWNAAHAHCSRTTFLMPFVCSSHCFSRGLPSFRMFPLSALLASGLKENEMLEKTPVIVHTAHAFIFKYVIRILLALHPAMKIGSCLVFDCKHGTNRGKLLLQTKQYHEACVRSHLLAFIFSNLLSTSPWSLQIV